MATKKSAPSWSHVKTTLVDFDRAGLLGLLQDFYAASKDNQAFLHARLSLGDDVLKPYKLTIDRRCVQESGHLGRQSQEADR
jgi:hypothetical protein